MDILLYSAFSFFIIHMLASTAMSHDLKKRGSFFNRLTLACLLAVCLIVDITLSLKEPQWECVGVLSAICQYGMFVSLMWFTGLYYYSFTSVSFILLDSQATYV